jgi:predicted 2-oxoglutarate/Fe(II)-dependent dioxygenase YbiX
VGYKIRRMPRLQFGELAPSFQAPTPSNPRYEFHTVGGRPVLLLFLGAPAGEGARRLMAEVAAHRTAFDDTNLILFIVVNDPADIPRLGIEQSIPGIRYFMDYDRSVASTFGFTSAAGDGSAQTAVILLDRTLRCLQTVIVGEDKAEPVLPRLIDGARRLTAWQASAPNINHAPVLVVERIFEPALCRALIDYYAATGGKDSGFMREKDGYTVGQLDPAVKRRRDCVIEDDKLRNATMNRVSRRLAPMLRRACQFEATRIERHIVARYDATEGGFFMPHRDNTTKGTAHRRFAVTINLNAEEYEGGDLRLPEFGPQAYRAPTGGAVVFSCSLLHEALPVTKGTRYAYLPFLYGEADAELRQRNLAFVADSPSAPQASPDRGPEKPPHPEEPRTARRLEG